MSGARPGACLHRVRELGLIDLNLPGRHQNKKHRPTVREVGVQKKWLDHWEKKGLALHAGRYCGYASVDSVDTGLQRWRVKADVNVPLMSAYSAIAWRRSYGPPKAHGCRTNKCRTNSAIAAPLARVRPVPRVATAHTIRIISWKRPRRWATGLVR